MTFLIILLLFILFFYFLPNILRWVLAYTVKRRLRKAFGNAGATGSSKSRHARGTENSPKAAASKPKKIDPSVGEFVQFEELKVFHSTEVDVDNAGNVSQTERLKVEEQIVDAEWEDI